MASYAGVSVTSDEVDIHNCEICEELSQEVEATAYCCNCCQYMCNSCSDMHRVVRATKTHKLLSGKNLPTAYAVSTSKALMLCKVHKSEPVKYFCLGHNSSCCSTCAIQLHRQCEDMKELSELAAGIRESSLYTDTMKMYSHLESKIHAHKLVQEKDLNSRKYQIKAFNKATDDVRMNLKALTAKKQENVDKCHHLEKALQNKQRDAMNMIQESTEEIAFLMLRDEDSTCKYYQTQVQKMQNECETCDKVLKKSIHDLIGCLSRKVQPGLEVAPISDKKEQLSDKSLGIVTESTKGRESSSQGAGHLSKIKSARVSSTHEVLKPNKKYNMRLSSDKKECFITDIKEAADGQYLVLDNSNDNLKKLNAELKLISVLEFHSAPWGVAIVNTKQVAITFPHLRQIQFVQIDKNEMTQKKTLNTHGCYFGIACMHERLFLCNANTGEIDIIRISGIKIKSIKLGDLLQTFDASDASDSKKPSTCYPRFISASIDGTVLYVSDWMRGCIYGISTDKDIRFVTGALENPNGSSLDADGNLYVCEGHTKTVIKLSADGKRLKGFHIGLHPQCVCFCRNGQLLVGEYKSNFIQKFDLK